MNGTAAYQFMIRNGGVTEDAKSFIHDNPGCTWNELHKSLTTKHDIKQASTKLILMGLRASGFILPVGRDPESGTKKWALATAAKTMSLDDAIEVVILQILRSNEWLSTVSKKARESLPSITHKDVLTEVQMMVEKGTVVPVQARFTDGKLYPDILLARKGFERTTSDSRVPSTLVFNGRMDTLTESILTYLKACRIKGIPEVSLDEVVRGTGVSKSTTKRSLAWLHKRDVISVTRPVTPGRGHKLMVVLI